MVVLRRNNTVGGGAAFAPIETTLGANGSLLVAAGFVGYITAKAAGATAAFKAGITPGGTELIGLAEDIPLAPGVTENFGIGITFDAATTIFFTGITSLTLIKIYKF